MLYRDIGALPVFARDLLVGILTDRDITIRVTAKGCNPNKTQVEEAMTWKIESCFEDQDVEEAVRIMEDKKIRRLLVHDHNQKLVGIVSLADIVLKTHNQKLVDEALEKISEPAMWP